MAPELPSSDRIPLAHILKTASEAIDFSAGRNRSSLDTDAMFQSAVKSCFYDIGLAASHVSGATRTRTPQVAWQRLIDTRNQMVEALFDIDSDVLWGAIHTDFPSLVASLEPIIQSTSSGTNP